MRTEMDFELNGISDFVTYWVYKETLHYKLFLPVEPLYREHP